MVDRYQQHEIPQVSVRITQFDQHQVQCSCGTVHTASRPEGARSGPVGYGPNLQAFAVYLMVVHFIPAHRVGRRSSVTGWSEAADLDGGPWQGVEGGEQTGLVPFRDQDILTRN